MADHRLYLVLKCIYAQLHNIPYRKTKCLPTFHLVYFWYGERYFTVHISNRCSTWVCVINHQCCLLKKCHLCLYTKTETFCIKLLNAVSLMCNTTVLHIILIVTKLSEHVHFSGFKIHRHKSRGTPLLSIHIIIIIIITRDILIRYISQL